MAIEVSVLMDAFVNSNIEGCVQVLHMNAGYDDYKPETVIFLDGIYQTGCTSANTSEGWVDRCILKEGHTAPIHKSDVLWDEDKDEILTKRLYGEVLILVCSPKILRLLQEICKDQQI